MRAPDLSIPCYCLQVNSQIRNCQGKWFICYRDFWHFLVELLSTVSSSLLDISLWKGLHLLSLMSWVPFLAIIQALNIKEIRLRTVHYHSKAVGAQLSWLISHIVSKLSPSLNVAELVGGSLVRTRAEKDLWIQWLYTFSCSDDLGGEHRLWLVTWAGLMSTYHGTRHCFRHCSLWLWSGISKDVLHFWTWHYSWGKQFQILCVRDLNFRLCEAGLQNCIISLLSLANCLTLNPQHGSCILYSHKVQRQLKVFLC